MRHAIVVVLIAYLITGVHWVWRDLREPVGRQAAYARSRKLPVLILAVLTWLPAARETCSHREEGAHVRFAFLASNIVVVKYR